MTRKLRLAATIAALMLLGGGVTFPANAAETGCVPFDPSGAVCAASVPAHSLSQGDPDDLYKGFTFVTNTYPLADAEFDDNWTYLQRGGEASSINASNIMVPSKIGATVKLPNAGTWTDAQGEEHELDATLTVTDTNGGLIVGYTNDGDGVQYLALGGLRGDHHDLNDPIGEKVSAAEPQPTDDSKRTGIEVKVSFTYAGTDTPVPDSFKGLTGFGDLDGKDGSPAGIEGVELIDGFDGLWLPDDDHLTAFDENGYGGSDECREQLNLSARHAQQHMFTAAFSGPDFTVRYSQGASKSSYAAVFSAPLLADQLVYKVTARAVDENGNEIKAPWTVTDGLRVNGTYELTDIPAIDGYEYVGPAKDSAPLRGSVTSNGESGDRTITLTYKRLATINYNGNGGKGTVAGETVDAGTDVDTKPNGFTRVGYTFKGWNTKPDGTGTPYQPGADIRLDGDVTLYAMWEANPASILFDPNAKNTTGETTGIDTVYDADVTLTPNGYQRPGYTFTGWNTKPDNTGTGYADKAAYHVTGDVTLYAQWKADKASLVYNANGGTGSMDSTTGVTNQTVTVDENGFTYMGHRFTGWNSMPDGSGDTYNPGDGYTLPAGVGVLYAQWEEIPASLTYDGNGDDVTGETPDYTGLAEDTPIVSENGFDWPGHEFKGWNTKPDGTGDTFQPGDTMTPLTGDAVLYAQWDELPATVTYDPNGGTGTTNPYKGLIGDTPQTADNGFTAPDDCMTFVGWNTAKDGSGVTYKPGDTLPPLTDDITLYAQWDDTGCTTESLAQTGVGLSGILTTVSLMLAVGGLAKVMRRKRD